MGNHVSHPVATSVDALVDEVPSFVLEKRLGSARFIKTLRGRYQDGQPTVVKVFVKPEMDFDVQIELHRAQLEAQSLRGAPYTCGYSQIFETDKAVFLCRPYFHSNLYDRISTRPFLDLLERKWIAFQLLSAVAHIHSVKIRHGDIKTENVMITSWNGVYLTDMASFKPTCLPVDNPADFVYFFDASSRRTCYLAPERFQEDGALDLTEAMDMFSVGCVLAELFLEGHPIFNLSQLLKYRKEEYDPTPELANIGDSGITVMVKSMISLDPSMRPSARELLEQNRGIVFPDAFYTWFGPFSLFFAEPPAAATELCPGEAPLCVADQRILYLWEERERDNIPSSLSGLVLGYVTCSIRALTYPRTQLMALDLLVHLVRGISDDQRLDRAVPALCWLVQAARTPSVRAEALEALAELVGSVQVISSEDVGLFTEILFPLFTIVANDPEPLVRATFAECLADLADACVRFLEIAQATVEEEKTRDESTLYSLQTFDVILADVQRTFLDHLQSLITDESVFVRRAILSKVTRLCVFFGRQTANDVILSHTITYLNDKDAPLRSAFFESMAGVGTVAGEKSLQEYVLPLLLQSLHDPNDTVVERVMSAISALVELGLFQKFQVRLITRHTSPFLFHPNVFLRYACVAVICACSRILAPLDVACLMAPILRPYLKYPPPLNAVAPISLLRLLKPPLRRSTLEILAKQDRDPKVRAQLSPEELYKLELVRKAFPVASLTWGRNGRSHGSSTPSLYEKSISMQNLSVAPHTVFLTPGAVPSATSSSRGASGHGASLHSLPRTHRRTQPLIVSPLERRKGLTPRASEPNLRRRMSVSTAGSSLAHSSFSANDTALLPLKATAETSTVNATVTASLARSSSVLNLRQQVAISRTPVFQPALGQSSRRSPRPSDASAGGPANMIGPRPTSEPLLDHTSLMGWRPMGALLAHLQDHAGPVHALAVSRDGSLLVSASEDGTVKAWEVARVHKNLAVKARVTHHVGGAVKTVAFLESSNCVACASETGNLQVVALDSRARAARVVRDIKLPGEACVAVAHIRTDLESILLVATATGHIYGFDPTSVAFVMETPPAYGVISCMLVDPRCNWLLIGTMRGILLLFDLRLRLLVSKWTHPSRSRIHALAHHPGERDHVVVAAGKGECSVWHLVSNQCTDVFTRHPPADSYQAMSPPKPDDFIQNSMRVFQETQAGDGVYALASPLSARTAAHLAPASNNSDAGIPSPALNTLFFGGTDRKLRAWEVGSGTARVICGRLEAEADAIYDVHVRGRTRVLVETIPAKPPSRGAGGGGGSTGGGTSSTGSGGSASAAVAGFTLQERSAMVAHHDAVTALAVLHAPQPMLASAARDGSIKLWK